MIVFYAYKVEEGLAYLDGEESRHCMKVLRKRTGGIVNFTNGKGKRYTGLILGSGREVILNNIQLIEEIHIENRVVIAISPTKNLSRFEWFVEKGVEIGITDIIPLICRRTEKDSIKVERTEKIIRSAAKQSLNYNHPNLIKSMSVKELVDHYRNIEVSKYIASFNEKNQHLFQVDTQYRDSLILIGPEGDFTDEELDMVINDGYQKVNISRSRLRTETAGIVAAEILCLKNEIACDYSN